MSATPEQIAERLEHFGAEITTWDRGAIATGYLKEAQQMRTAAALIRAQTERVRVLEEALWEIVRQSGSNRALIDTEAANYYAENCAAIHQVARAALKAAP